jgi:hypothetical protein
MQENRQVAELQARERIIKKSNDLAQQSFDDMSLNEKCMLCVENLKLQLEILKFDLEERRKIEEERKNHASLGLSVQAAEWCPGSWGSYPPSPGPYGVRSYHSASL